MSVGVESFFPDPVGPPSFILSTVGLGTVGGDVSLSAEVETPFSTDAGFPLPLLKSNLNRIPGFGVLDSLIMRRLADEAAIEEGVCIGVPAVREPWNGELKVLEGLFTPKPRG